MIDTSSQRRLLLLSQVYVPDPASVGQHLHDVATEMVRRGWRVTVICSSRGYDNPTTHYARHEVRDGVGIIRYGLPIFSKTNMPLRVFGSLWAAFSLFVYALTAPRTDCVLFSTSPPMIGVLGVMIAALKHARSVYWAMDLNPDQLLAIGKIRRTSFRYRLLESINKIILRRSNLTVSLDRFMAERLCSDGRRLQQSLTIPPWPHETATNPLAHAENPFRDQHGLTNKFVVMYSGNHSPANPLETLLQAVLALKDDSSICFAFIGGGIGKKRVKAFIAEHQLKNVLELPYQPFDQLRYSLSAADVHVVTLGNDMVGIVHPCKVYGAMTVGRPILFIGPEPSHVADLLDKHDIGRSVRHGNVAGCIAAIHELRALDPARLEMMGRAAIGIINSQLSEPVLNGRFCDAIERV